MSSRSTITYILPVVLLVCFLLGLPGCKRLLPAPAPHPTQSRLQGVLNGHPIEHVVIFAIDGLAHDTLVHYLEHSPSRKVGGLHDLFGVRAESGRLVFTKGVAVQQSTTVFPSYTYPAWTSAFTGVFPGAHGIAGNSLFSRDRAVARYYTEYHLDALKVQLADDFLSDDLNPQVKTLYEHIDQHGGQSIVVHHMLTRGSGAGVIPADVDTLLSYTQNRSTAVDANALWDAVHAIQQFNDGDLTSGALRLPSVLTIYFAGLDHAEHVSPEDPEQARLEYLAHLDDLIAKFIAGDPALTKQHHASTGSGMRSIDPIRWSGVRNEAVLERTLFVLVSDHGHTAIDWNTAVGIDDLKLVFDELNTVRGTAYRLELPSLIDETLGSKIRAAFGLFSRGAIARESNVVATLNGGALGFHVKPSTGEWTENPDYHRDLVPIVEHVLLTLHANHQDPDAVLIKQENRYDYLPYQFDGTTVQLSPAISLEYSRLNSPSYPMAVRRVTGLASRLPTDPLSAPDIILLADRSKHLTYLNKQDGRVLEQLDVSTHRHFHSDHGHLNASDSLVPILFVRGGQEEGEALASLCEASVVDITPTILDTLGLLPSFQASVQTRPEEMTGHSLKSAMDRILAKAFPVAGGENICPSSVSLGLPHTSN